jgi:hypothetical protein
MITSYRIYNQEEKFRKTNWCPLGRQALSYSGQGSRETFKDIAFRKD